MKHTTSLLILGLTLGAGGPLLAQKNWASFGQDQGATRYSDLKQINTTNVQKLTRAWTFHTGVKTANQATPIVIDSVMYISAANGYYALDAVTGAQIWKFDAVGTTGRGVSYWPGDARSPARIIGALTGDLIVALDARTGKPVAEFGKDGYVDIGTRMQSPPAIYKDLLIAPSMDRLVRAWNASHRGAGVDVQPRASAWRARPRDVGKRRLENHRRAERVGPHHRRHGPADRVRADRSSFSGLRGRQPPGQHALRHITRRARRRHRQAEVVPAARASRSCGTTIRRRRQPS